MPSTAPGNAQSTRTGGTTCSTARNEGHGGRWIQSRGLIADFWGGVW